MNDPLFGNKIASAALVALLLVFGIPQLTKALTGGGHHGGESDELHLAYCCVDLETAAPENGGAAAAMSLGDMMANSVVSAGERASALCKSCHSFEEGGPNGTGPNLWDVVGREVAGVDGFNYTNALRGLGGVWTYERLDEYLKDSQGYVPGTAMVQRIPQDDRRANILAYLGSLSDNPEPYPAPTSTAETTDDAAESDETDAE